MNICSFRVKRTWILFSICFLLLYLIKTKCWNTWISFIYTDHFLHQVQFFTKGVCCFLDLKLRQKIRSFFLFCFSLKPHFSSLCKINVVILLIFFLTINLLIKKRLPLKPLLINSSSREDYNPTIQPGMKQNLFISLRRNRDSSSIAIHKTFFVVRVSKHFGAIHLNIINVRELGLVSVPIQFNY